MEIQRILRKFGFLILPKKYVDENNSILTTFFSLNLEV